MIYENLSPEAKAGIEQFRTFIKTVPKERVFSYVQGGAPYVILKGGDRLCYSIMFDACILHGASAIDADNACFFAREKNYWTNE